MAFLWMRCFMAVLLLTSAEWAVIGAIPIGVCYGLNGDNLLPPTDVIALYKSKGIERLRLYDPNHGALEALRGSNLKVIVGVRNQDLHTIANSQDAANSWVASNISPYNDVNFTHITLGNEVVPSEMAQYVAPAIQNIHNAVTSTNLSIKVSTAVSMAALGASYPPSEGAFTDAAVGPMTAIATVLTNIGSPIMLNVYPYFAYAADPAHISLDYALFNASSPIRDNDLEYYSLFDAMVDAFAWAMSKVGGRKVAIGVSESGWPSAGNGNITTVEIAQAYNRRLIDHVLNRGTPKTPRARIDTFIFEMFNEDLKSPGIEQNFGLFYPDGNPVYSIF